jgi:hypothetical protein
MQGNSLHSRTFSSDLCTDADSSTRVNLSCGNLHINRASCKHRWPCSIASNVDLICAQTQPSLTHAVSKCAETLHLLICTMLMRAASAQRQRVTHGTRQQRGRGGADLGGLLRRASAGRHHIYHPFNRAARILLELNIQFLGALQRSLVSRRLNCFGRRNSNRGGRRWPYGTRQLRSDRSSGNRSDRRKCSIRRGNAGRNRELCRGQRLRRVHNFNSTFKAWKFWTQL